jgi:hypothetical protein
MADADGTRSTSSAEDGGLVGASLENCRYDRMFLASPPPRPVGVHLMLTVGYDRPCVRIHLVHAMS